MERKTILIADCIHGSIQISYLEKQVISTQAFNRLHNILQNSTAYLTYPSNQTKRFSHSLGSMHLVGEMFFKSIVNATEETRNEFLRTAKEYIEERIIADDEFVNEINKILGSYVRHFEDVFSNFQIDDPLYRLGTPNVIKTDQIFVYLVLYQSLRVAALLHDVGHPPFSHVIESALKTVLQQINQIQEKDRTSSQKFFLQVFEGYKEKSALHEQIGLKIANRILASISSGKPSNNEEAKNIFYSCVVQRFVMSVLKKESQFFIDLGSLISGVIDCDRLDYVKRDLKNSGFAYGDIEYDRLISCMKLVKHENRFRFCPSIRTLSTVEEFLQRRLFLYKYVVYHHRVIKTDQLLEQALITLIMDCFKCSEDTKNTQKTEDTLPLDISGLWKAIQNVFSNTSYFNALIQWDDAWLLTVLKQQFFKKYQKSEDEIIKYQLEEFLSNRKYYRSMIKRVEDFIEIEKSILENLKIDWERIEKTTEDSQLSFIKKLKDFQQQYLQKQRYRAGFFLTNIIRWMALNNVLLISYLNERIAEAIQSVAKEGYKVSDCLIVFKELKTGVEEIPYVYEDNEVIPLDRVSNIIEYLDKSCDEFPKFFVYLRGGDSVKKKEFLQKIGKRIAQQLVEDINCTFGA